MPKISIKSKLLRRIGWGTLWFCAFCVIATAVINWYVLHCSRGRIHFQTEEFQENAVGLVLGTELKRPDGSANLHFLTRTTAAERVYAAGKVKHLVISGNPNNRGFNEPLDIQKALLTNGIPEDAITLDATGITTWDSIRTAAETQKLKKVTIITDAFHAPRALFLCRHFGIDAVAFCDEKNSSGYWLYRSELREYFARVKAFFQACFD